jgi:hypothetical protein
MSETYIRNAVAQIQERRSNADAANPHSHVGIGQDGTLINTRERFVQNVSGMCVKIHPPSLIPAQVPEPGTFNPPNAHLFEPGQSIPNVSFLRQHFLHEGRLTEDQALMIIQRTTEVFEAEPNLVQVKSPVTSERPYRFLRSANWAQYVAIYTVNMCVFMIDACRTR